MKDLLTHIALNEPITDDTRRLRFPVDWKSFDPGQFVMVEIPGGDVFLRRPFGVAALEGGEAEVCYKIVGRGTSALSKAPVCTPLRVLGPLGKGFRVLPEVESALLVAGGYGIAPLFGLAVSLRRKGIKVKVFYGGKRAGELLYLDELKASGAQLFLSTEDGSAGFKGLVTDLLENEIKSIEGPAIFACGPHGMLAATARIGIARNIPTQVSMEEYMACGIGVCQGCVCRDRDGGFVRTCSDGPVFDAAAIEFSP